MASCAECGGLQRRLKAELDLGWVTTHEIVSVLSQERHSFTSRYRTLAELQSYASASHASEDLGYQLCLPNAGNQARALT